MKIYYSQLHHHLHRSLAPIYILVGDEPWQKMDARQQIRQKVQQAGYQWQLAVIEQNSDWQKLTAENYEQSLFSTKVLIDVLSYIELGQIGSHFLKNYQPDEQRILLLSLPKTALKGAWFKAMEQAGAIIIPIYDLNRKQLFNWIQQRIQQTGLQADAEAMHLLVEYSEGNLLAAQQEIDKLSLLYPRQHIRFEQIQYALSDQSRFNIYALTEAVLNAQTERCLHILQRLRAEGIEPILVLWLLTKTIRQGLQLRQAWEQARDCNQIFQQYQIWKNQQNFWQKALTRLNSWEWRKLLQYCLTIDQYIKNNQDQAAWFGLEQLSLRLAGLISV